MTSRTFDVAVCCSEAIPAQLAQQPRVLDGDHGLIGEFRHQLDLLLAKWADFLAG